MGLITAGLAFCCLRQTRGLSHKLAGVGRRNRGLLGGGPAPVKSGAVIAARSVWPVWLPAELGGQLFAWGRRSDLALGVNMQDFWHSCQICFTRPKPGVRPGGRLTFLVSPRKVSKRKRPCRMALRVRSDAQVCRAAPNSLRYAAFRQGARRRSLESLRDARQTLRSSPMQKGHSKEHGSLRVASQEKCGRVHLTDPGAARLRVGLGGPDHQSSE